MFSSIFLAPPRATPLRATLAAALAFVCLLGSAPANAVDVIYVGPPGSSGLDGTAPGAPGSAGAAAPAAARDFASFTANNLLHVTGGAGGRGGNGASGAPGQPAGAAGAGGAGGLGAATLAVTAPALPVTFSVAGTGGAGGHAGQSGQPGDPLAPGDNAAGGAGGQGQSYGVLNTIGPGPVQASASAIGGAGGNALFGPAGHGGRAFAELDVTMIGARNAAIAGTATGGAGGSAAGSPFDSPEWGSPGNGGSASSSVRVAGAAPASNGWNAVIDVTSTAQGGEPGSGFLALEGGAAEATLTVSAYGRSSGKALARGSAGGDSGGAARASAVVGSALSATASADAGGGGAYYNAGAGARAYAEANGGYHARADAVAMSGSGRFGATSTSTAEAVASVHRQAGVLQPSAPGVPAEARAHALASYRGGTATVTSNYRDDLRNAAVRTSASSSEAGDYQAEAESAANVGGPLYDAWQINNDNPSHVSAYASALPDPRALAPLLAGAPRVTAGLSDAALLGAGTLGAAFFPLQASTGFTLPFTRGQHLVLGLFNPFSADGLAPTFTFSVSHGDTMLYQASISTAAQYAALFDDRLLDLGAIDNDTLDLIVQFSLTDGAAGFNYALGAVTAVPEASTWLLLLLGLALLGWCTSRRRPLRPLHAAHLAGAAA